MGWIRAEFLLLQGEHQVTCEHAAAARTHWSGMQWVLDYWQLVCVVSLMPCVTIIIIIRSPEIYTILQLGSSQDWDIYNLLHIQLSVWHTYGSMESMHVCSYVQDCYIVVSWQVQLWCGVLLYQWMSVQVCFSKVDRWFCCTACLWLIMFSNRNQSL